MLCHNVFTKTSPVLVVMLGWSRARFRVSKVMQAEDATKSGDDCRAVVE